MDVLVVILCLFAVPIGVLWAGAGLSLDRSRSHSVETAELPMRNARRGPADGLVRIQAGDLEFRARLSNFDGAGEAVVLLHGFPQTSACWEPAMVALAKAGYRVVGYDQRGYSPGARPLGVDAYRIDKLASDVMAVADALGLDRFHLVGHDWGAAVGWAVTMTRPQRLLSWSALSIGHSFAFRDAVRGDVDQRKRSRYILLFQLPFLPERLLAWGRFYLLRRIMYHCMPTDHVREYLSVFAEPGALTAVLNYYRAMGDSGGLAPIPGVSVPTLYVWGNRDPAAGRTAAEGTASYMLGPYVYSEIDAGHWLLETRREQVVEQLVDHVANCPDLSSTKAD